MEKIVTETAASHVYAQAPAKTVRSIGVIYVRIANARTVPTTSLTVMPANALAPTMRRTQLRTQSQHASVKTTPEERVRMYSVRLAMMVV
jgi:hypothetical protein